MIFTNEEKHGGSFIKEFLAQVKESDNLRIASGYFGTDLIEDIQSSLVSISEKGGCRILLGMVFHGGVSEKQRLCLSELDAKLRETNPQNGIYISRKDYHGKIYQIGNDVYIGSSNFSKEGFVQRWECTAKINDERTAKATANYLDFLFSQDTTEKISDVELGTSWRVPRESPSKFLADYKVDSLSKGPVIGQVNIKLRVDDQPASSLNLFFDKGRKNKNGLYAPRPWYEVEITSSVVERKSPFYPKSKRLKTGKKSQLGVFNAYIVEDKAVYKLKMKVASDNGKALMTSKNAGGRETLGRYIKGKLEAVNILKYGERITSEMLELYGRDYITLKKIDDQNYILEF